MVWEPICCVLSRYGAPVFEPQPEVFQGTIFKPTWRPTEEGVGVVKKCCSQVAQYL